MKKIANIKIKDLCKSPSHDPPGMICLPEGIYEHVCVDCNERQTVIISPKPSL